MWIPQENENSQGTASHQPQKKTWQKTPNNSINPSRKGLSLPKSLRILSRRHFQKLSIEGARLPGKVLFLQYFQTKTPTRLGITVSKKYGKAHDRNYFKRLVRETFREIYDEIPEGTHLNILPRFPRKIISKELVVSDFRSFITSLRKGKPC